YLDGLLEINTKIGASGMVSPTTLLSSIAEEAARLLDVDNAGFRLLEGDDLVLAGCAGTARETMVRERVKLGQGLSGRAFAAGHALVLDVEAADIAPDELANVRRLGYTTFLGVPLKIGGRAIGVLTFRARRPFSARDQELAEAFAGQSAIAIEHARLVREASEQADRMRALADLSRVFAGTLDPDVVSERIADSVRSLFSSVSASLFRVEPGSGDLVPVATSTGRVGAAPRGGRGAGAAGAHAHRVARRLGGGGAHGRERAAPLPRPVLRGPAAPARRLPGGPGPRRPHARLFPARPRAAAGRRGARAGGGRRARDRDRRRARRRGHARVRRPARELPEFGRRRGAGGADARQGRDHRRPRHRRPGRARLHRRGGRAAAGLRRP